MFTGPRVYLITTAVVAGVAVALGHIAYGIGLVGFALLYYPKLKKHDEPRP